MQRNQRSQCWCHHIWSTLILSILFTIFPSARSDHIAAAEHVFILSYDGLMPHAMARKNLPNFARLRREGAGTDNARNDYDIAQTLPTHMSMFTGLPVEKHGIKKDKDSGQKIDPSIQNIFDLVSATGAKTCMFVTKEKFRFFQRSWKIDEYYFSKETQAVKSKFMQEMKGNDPCKFTFLHFRDADFAGHRYRGESYYYHKAVAKLDFILGEIFEMIDSSPHLKGKTAFILTSDHGFAGSNHADETKEKNYHIPFNVWGPGAGVTPAADLYLLNSSTRKNPGLGRPSNTGPQPVRCHDAGPTAATLLGIGAPSGRFSLKDLTVGRSSSALSVLDTGIGSTEDRHNDSNDFNDSAEMNPDASVSVALQGNGQEEEETSPAETKNPSNNGEYSLTPQSVASEATDPRPSNQIEMQPVAPPEPPTQGRKCKAKGGFCTRNYECCNTCKKFNRVKGGEYKAWNKCR